MNTVTFKNERKAYELENQIDPQLLQALARCNGYVAGGAVTSIYSRKPVRDFDLYFPTFDDQAKFLVAMNIAGTAKLPEGNTRHPMVSLKAYNHALKKSNKTAQVIFITRNARTFLWKEQTYQVITAFNMPPEELFAKFDFTVCMGAYLPASRNFVTHENFFSDLAERRLCINVGTEYPICTIVRIFKYQKKGFTVFGSDIIKIALAVHKLELDNYKTLSNQLEGIDTLFMKELTDLLRSDAYREKAFDFDEFLRILDNYFQTKWIDDHFGGAD